MLDGRFRNQVDAWVKPIGQSVKRTGISADAITVVGIFMTLTCAIAIGSGAVRVGLVLMALTGIPDTLDGAVAKASGTSSQRGSFFDSVSDRLTDALMFGGVAWYLSTLPNPGQRPVLAFAAFASAILPSYIRAKADALGLDGRGGFVERAERFVLLGIGLLFDQYLLVVLAILVALNLLTAGQRFVNVWRAASKPLPAPRQRNQRRGPRTTSPSSERWMARREQMRQRGKSRHLP